MMSFTRRVQENGLKMSCVHFGFLGATNRFRDKEYERSRLIHCFTKNTIKPTISKI